MLQNFLSALRSLPTPLLDLVNPGLHPSELHEITGATCPELIEFADETVITWWSWQNGVDQTRHAQAQETNPEVASCHVVTPDGLMLDTLEGLLEQLASMVEPEEMSQVPVFPIGADYHGGIYALRRPVAAEPWRIWYCDPDEAEWQPLERQGSGPPPTFSEWLNALTSGISAGRIVVGQWGNLASADDDDHRYPWGGGS